MSHGGARPGAGRKNDSIQGLNALSKENRAVVEAALADLNVYGKSTNELPPDISPLDLLLHVMRNNKTPLSVRITCATVAAPYVHPRLTSSKVTVQKENNLEEILQVVRAERDRIGGDSAKVVEHKDVEQVDMFNNDEKILSKSIVSDI